MPHKTQMGKLKKSNQEQYRGTFNSLRIYIDLKVAIIIYQVIIIIISKYHFKHYLNLEILVVIAQNRYKKNNIYFSQGIRWQPNRSTTTWSLHLQRRVDSPVSNKLKPLYCIDYPYIRLVYQTSAKFLQAQFMVSNRRSLVALQAS